MQLRFMGQTYTTANNKVETVATQQTASFKGQKYQVRIPVQAAKSQLNTEERKYRGITYTVKPQKYTLGSNELKPCY